MAKTIKPLGDRILVRTLGEGEREGKTASGIVIPDTAHKERATEGKIVAVGEGRVTEEGKLLKPRVKKGQVVLFSQYSPSEVKVDGKEYLIIKEDDILAIIE
ncbi:MAG: co-chaperone GroES [Parcubacteria group bacterium]|nr:co-chaperone GroES [Parcubacteria group bacterium]MBI2175416.1 co-chaperone GroES [Parcubacteria group bacterium]